MLKLAIPTGAALLVTAMAATNPDETAHVRALVDHAKRNCWDSSLAREMCGGMASLASLALSYDDHLLYSTARVGSVDTVGVLGRVMVVSE